VFEWLKSIARQIKTEFDFYKRLQQHPQTPKIAKFFLWLAIGYILLPFDLIPDFIPVLGQLDEVVIIPLLIYCALKCTPQHVIDSCRIQIARD
jgi:uncharacterized membrane protein YkvA (DUF1232 family)